MRPLKPLYLFVLLALAVAGWMSWTFYKDYTRWNEEVARPAPSPMDALTFVSVSPVEDHTFKPPRVHSISVQVDGRHAGRLVVELQDSATKKVMLHEGFSYNGSLSAREDIEIGHLGPGVYFSKAWFDGDVKHMGRVEVK